MRRSALHLIPATMLAACLVLTVKLGNIWEALSSQDARELMPIASAEEKKEDVPAPPTAGEPAAGASPAQDDPAAAVALAVTAPGRTADGILRMAYSSAEMELLQKLSARREELDGRERELDMREGLLKAAEQQLEAKSAELTELQEKIQGLVHEYDEQENTKLASLVKIYEQMKPKDAARIMNELEMDILIDVMQRMREAKAASILASMDPARARDVTARLAQRAALQDLGEAS